MSRHAGLLIPLFSIPSARSWGMGELPDLATLGDWAAGAGFDRLMILPLGTAPAGETSPYSSISTMAIDPMYVAMDEVEDFVRAGGRPALPAAASEALVRAQQADRIRYDDLRRAKREALEIAFGQFLKDDWEHLTTRAAALAAYISRERWWLDDYAIFQAATAANPGVPWPEWSDGLAERDPQALDRARRRWARPVLREQYWQWIAESQWQRTRARLGARGVTVFGDMPFGTGAGSPEVWARPREFMLEVSTGVPPDAFSATGQDWKLPTYRWDAIRATGYAWFRARTRRSAALFDGIRVDHLVGLYRTYGKPPLGEAFFNPEGEAAQTAQGEQLLAILRESGLTVLAEDLGTVPDFVRASMARLGVPGTKVLRWERAWREWHRGFIDPATFPSVSVTMTGTHDNEPLAAWWDSAGADDRAALLSLPLVRARAGEDIAQPWSETLRDALLELALRSGSDELFLPIQDLFGWRDRINTPATVGDQNWTWRLPWRVDALASHPLAQERGQALAGLAARAERSRRDPAARGDW
jgi:4-alpha-glucanotransferase